ncbi:hypothetical protein B7463_g9348, partial [Scytalidium lignicola]
MDPLSIAASIIALIGAAKGSVEGLKKLRQFYKAPAEIDALINEIEDLRLLIADMNITEYEHMLCTDNPALSKLLGNAKEQLIKLDKIMEYRLRPRGSSSRIGWTRASSKITGIRSSVREIKSNLVLQLVRLSTTQGYRTFSYLGRVDLSLQQVSLSTQSMLIKQDSLEERLQNLFEASQNISPGSSSINSISNVTQDAHTEILSSSDQSFVELQAARYVDHNCDRWCKCACHMKKKWASPQVFDLVVGQLLLGYTGFIRPHQKCSKLSCRQQSDLKTQVTYRFPSWFVALSISIMIAKRAMQTPEMLVRVLRVRPYGSTDLFRFATHGNIGKLQDLFNNGEASPWDVQPDGRNALHFSFGQYNLDTCRFLISKGIDVNFEDQNQKSALSHAWDGVLSRVTRHGQPVATIEQLREIFGDSDYLDSQRFNKLHRLVIGLDHGDLEATLREGDFDPDDTDTTGRTPLYWAASRGDTAKVRLLLDYGASPNAGLSVITGVVHHFEFERSPLGFTHYNRLEVAKMLVEAGVDLTVKENDGYTPLHAAARHAEGHEFIKILLEKGLDPSVHNFYGQTPLHDACGQNHVKCVEVLIENGADINKTHGPSRPPIFDAIDHRNHESIELLLNAGASLEFVDVQRNSLTILHWLARHGDRRTWQIFESADFAGLDAEQKSASGETAIQLFDRERSDAEAGMREAFMVLLDHVRNCNAAKEASQDIQMASIDHVDIPGAWINESHAFESGAARPVPNSV